RYLLEQCVFYSPCSLNFPSFLCCVRGAQNKMLLKMPQKLLKTAHYIELGSYQHWPVLVPHRIRLYTYEQIPRFLKENPYITDGYRAHLTSKLCLKR
ncbi:Progestin and adipoQ receptor member 3, partial [Goodea atripinnis]